MLAALTAVLAGLIPAAAPADRPVPATYAGPSGRVALTRGWTYAADPSDGGLAAGWAGGRFRGAAVSVPHAANAALHGPGAAAAAYRGSVGWYRHDIRTAGGDYALRFESVAFAAQVFVDGRSVATHIGAYAPFEARARLGPGRHRIVVRADWRSPAAQTRAGYHRTWFNYGGINRDVTLRRVGASEVTGAAVQTRILPGGRAARVAIAVRVVNHGAPRPIGVLGRLGDGPLFATGTRRLARGQAATLTATVRVPRPRLWAPGAPRLYDLALGVPAESGYHVRVGLRELQFAGGQLRVNGRHTVLRGASLQEDAPGHGDALTPADMDGAVRRLRAIGATATRALHPLAPALLERLDRAGIAVWQEIGPVDSPGKWLADTAAEQAVATRRVREDLRANRLHPAILGWSLGCEVAGNGGRGQGAWTAARARELHAADPGRPVGVDVWSDHLPDVPGELYSELDAVGTTSYLGWYEDTFARPRALAKAIHGRVDAFARRFAGKLLLVAEFGAEGTAAAQNPEGARGGRGYQARLIAQHLRVYRREPAVDAVLIWTLQDFAINPAFRGGTISRRVPGIGLTGGLNQKGLFDRAGRAKPAARAARAGFAAYRQ